MKFPQSLYNLWVNALHDLELWKAMERNWSLKLLGASKIRSNRKFMIVLCGSSTGCCHGTEGWYISGALENLFVSITISWLIIA
jgi:hypothetical protein